MAVLLETSVGDIVVDLKVEEAPTACLNFLKLCKIKYYNNQLFFQVQKNYIARSGCPRNDGTSGTSIFGKLDGPDKRYFKDEISQKLKHNVKGTVGMASEKPHQNGSQFYITLRDKVESLDEKHTIIGSIAEGVEVLDKINYTMCDENEAPYQNIRIWHTAILDDPFPDPEGLHALIPPKSPPVITDEEMKKIETAEEEAELEEKMATTLAKSQATTLELLHDLPDAEIEVPENDLFVTCLNPITQDGDLELIFSRFGPIKKCEIVRDWKTGDSLQYGFITFENTRDCEEAYFKMHNCVIDDRRIVVNFSQSVAKLWNKFRTGGRMTAAEGRDAGAKGKGRGRGRGGPGKGKGKGGAEGGGGEAMMASAVAPARGRDAKDQSKHGLVFGDDVDSGRGRPRQAEPPRRSRSRERDRGRRDAEGGGRRRLGSDHSRRR